MLRLLKISTFSAAIHRVSDIIQNVRIIFETLHTRLLEALCDAKTDRTKMMAHRNTRNGSGEKNPV